MLKGYWVVNRIEVDTFRNSYYMHEKWWIFALYARTFSHFMGEFPL
jgi:hypothetical protein